MYTPGQLWKKIRLDPQAVWLVQGRTSQAARNIVVKIFTDASGRTPRLVALAILWLWIP